METEEFKQCESRLEAAQKKPIEAAGDFLRKFWEHIKKDIVSKIGEAIFEAAQKTVVITVPASWSQPARENTIKAAAMAGISEFDGITVHLAEESQAAALFVLKAEHIDRNLMVQVQPLFTKSCYTYVIYSLPIVSLSVTGAAELWYVDSPQHPFFRFTEIC